MTARVSTTGRAPAKATKKAATKRSPRAAAKPAPQAPAEDLDQEAAEVMAEAQARVDALIGPDGEIRPVQVGKRGRAGSELVTIFTLDGKDYQVPKRPGAAVIIKFQKDLRRKGRSEALWDLMVTLLGQEALDALAESPETSEEDVADVFTIVGHLAFGALAALQGAADPS